MTEKRFTISKWTKHWQEIVDNGKILTQNQVVELLNMLHEENEEIGTALDNMVTFKNKYRDKYKEVKKENEQLKFELQKLRKTVNKQYVTWREWE